MEKWRHKEIKKLPKMILLLGMAEFSMAAMHTEGRGVGSKAPRRSSKKARKHAQDF